MITVLTVRGTGEPVGGAGNMLTALGWLLDSSRYTIGADIAYPASVGPANSGGDVFGPSEAQSIAAGLPLLASAIRATPNLVGLAGYSLGAELVSAFLEAQAGGEYADCELAWVALVANPRRAPGESIDPGAVGLGINGAHGPWPHVPVFTAANPLDGITSCPDRSPLHALAEGMSAFSFATVGGWTAELAHQLIDGELLADDYTPAALIEAGQLMYGYLLGGQHTREYILGGYLQRLATTLNEL